jgi:hypothetical protein
MRQCCGGIWSHDLGSKTREMSVCNHAGRLRRASNRVCRRHVHWLMREVERIFAKKFGNVHAGSLTCLAGWSSPHTAILSYPVPEARDERSARWAAQFTMPSGHRAHRAAKRRLQAKCKPLWGTSRSPIRSSTQPSSLDRVFWRGSKATFPKRLRVQAQGSVSPHRGSSRQTAFRVPSPLNRQAAR